MPSHMAKSGIHVWVASAYALFPELGSHVLHQLFSMLVEVSDTVPIFTACFDPSTDSAKVIASS